jgi:hypothetical protein
MTTTAYPYTEAHDLLTAAGMRESSALRFLELIGEAGVRTFTVQAAAGIQHIVALSTAEFAKRFAVDNCVAALARQHLQAIT